jgi:hypothetical protein
MDDQSSVGIDTTPARIRAAGSLHGVMGTSTAGGAADSTRSRASQACRSAILRVSDSAVTPLLSQVC